MRCIKSPFSLELISYCPVVLLSTQRQPPSMSAGSRRRSETKCSRLLRYFCIYSNCIFMTYLFNVCWYLNVKKCPRSTVFMYITRLHQYILNCNTALHENQKSFHDITTQKPQLRCYCSCNIGCTRVLQALTRSATCGCQKRRRPSSGRRHSGRRGRT
jgi:hypothetical protein